MITFSPSYIINHSWLISWSLLKQLLFDDASYLTLGVRLVFLCIPCHNCIGWNTYSSWSCLLLRAACFKKEFNYQKDYWVHKQISEEGHRVQQLKHCEYNNWDENFGSKHCNCYSVNISVIVFFCLFQVPFVFGKILSICLRSCFNLRYAHDCLFVTIITIHVLLLHQRELTTAERRPFLVNFMKESTIEVGRPRKHFKDQLKKLFWLLHQINKPQVSNWQMNIQRKIWKE